MIRNLKPNPEILHFKDPGNDPEPLYLYLKPNPEVLQANLLMPGGINDDLHPHSRPFNWSPLTLHPEQDPQPLTLMQATGIYIVLAPVEGMCGVQCMHAGGQAASE